jgi:hypothetical protein
MRLFTGWQGKGRGFLLLLLVIIGGGVLWGLVVAKPATGPDGITENQTRYLRYLNDVERVRSRFPLLLERMDPEEKEGFRYDTERERKTLRAQADQVQREIVALRCRYGLPYPAERSERERWARGLTPYDPHPPDRPLELK